jgi:tRNA(Ile)-lysidine synthase
MHIEYNSRLLSKGETFIIGCSGGPDSMAALHYLTKGSHNSHGIVVFIDHGTVTSFESLQIVKQYCKRYSWEFVSMQINLNRPKHKSQEEYWRDERYKLFAEAAKLSNATKLITAHHLDDAVETYIFNALNGKHYTIPVTRDLNEDILGDQIVTVIRPFLKNTKQELLDYCISEDIRYYDDPTNHDGSNMRSYIRQHIIPHAKYVNPGLYTVVRTLIEHNPYKDFMNVLSNK